MGKLSTHAGQRGGVLRVTDSCSGSASRLGCVLDDGVFTFIEEQSSGGPWTSAVQGPIFFKIIFGGARAGNFAFFVTVQ